MSLLERSASAAIPRQDVLVFFLLLWLAKVPHKVPRGQVDIACGSLGAIVWRS